MACREARAEIAHGPGLELAGRWKCSHRSPEKWRRHLHAPQVHFFAATS